MTSFELSSRRKLETKEAQPLRGVTELADSILDSPSRRDETGRDVLLAHKRFCERLDYPGRQL